MGHTAGSGDRWRLIGEAFAQAVETPPEERPAVLERACGRDASLRHEVERLLEADASAGSFLEVAAGRWWPGATTTGSAVEGGGAELLPPGTMLAGRYKLQSLLGRGGMGAVYRAHDTALGSDVAIKVLNRCRTRNPIRVEAFRREVKLARLVSNPNVCRVHDIGQDAGSLFLTMEYVAGESLAHRLQQTGAMDPSSCERVLRHVAQGLAAAHVAGVVHRDLKPENVLLRAGTDDAVVVDFGIAGFEDDEHEGWIAGTHGYMSPEQLAGGSVDTRNDVYALGILAYRIAIGRLPEPPGRPESGEPGAGDGPRSLPAPLAAFVSACTRRDPAERPEDAAAALALLDSLCRSADAGCSGPGDTPASTGQRRSYRSRLLRVGSVGLTLGIVGAALWLGGRRAGSVVMEPARITAGDGGLAGGDLVLDDNHVVRRIRCDERNHVVVNADRCDLTLEGSCASLSVQGRGNRVRVAGPIAAIALLGDGNTVTWSADDNPRPPNVSDLGADNVARPSSRIDATAVAGTGR